MVRAAACFTYAPTKLTRDKGSFYVKCIPMQWPFNNLPGECAYESFIVLKGNTGLVADHRFDSVGCHKACSVVVGSGGGLHEKFIPN